MARRYSPRKIKKHRSYTVAEVADTVGVTVGTVRNWVRDGLPILTDKRPYLILGEPLRAFVSDKLTSKKRSLARDEVSCFRCREPRKAEAGLVEVVPVTAGRDLAKVICPVCGALACRMIGQKDLEFWSALQGPAKDNGRQDYTNPSTATSIITSEGDQNHAKDHT